MHQEILCSWNQAKTYFQSLYFHNKIINQYVHQQLNQTIFKFRLVSKPITQNEFLKQQIQSYNNNKFDSQIIFDTLLNIMVKNNIGQTQKIDISGLEEFHRNFLVLLHFHYVFMKSLHFELLENFNFQFNFILSLTEINLFQILQKLDNLFTNDQQQIFIEQFELSELGIELSLNYFLKINDLQKDFKKICESNCFSLSELNFIYVFSFERQDIFQQLSAGNKRDLSEMREGQINQCISKEIKDMSKTLQKIVEKCFDCVLDMLQTQKKSLIERLNRIIFYDYIEMVTRKNQPKGSDSLLDLYDISFCQGLLNKMKNNISELLIYKRELNIIKDQNISNKSSIHIEKQIKQAQTKCNIQTNYALIVINSSVKKSKSPYDQLVFDIINIQSQKKQ